MKYLLMIPGPVEIPDEIMEVFREDPVAHYGSEWRDFYLNAVAQVSRFFGTQGMSFIIPGSGSVGLETAAVSLCRNKKCLILKNGYFGERLYALISPHAGKTDVLDFGTGEVIDPDRVKRELDKTRADVVAMTHVETSTAMLNPLEDIAAVSREMGTLLYLDAVSSAGVENIEMDNWGIDVLIAASQKGLECPPGIATVTCSRKIIEEIEGTKPVSWYTDLRVWLEYFDKWQDWHPFPVTLPTNVVRALSKSLEIIESEGAADRYKKFRTVSNRFRKSLWTFGLKPFIPDNLQAHGITSVKTEGSIDSTELVRFMKQKMGIQIAGSLGELRRSVFRIGHLSRRQCEINNLMKVIIGIGLYMKSIDIEVNIDPALEILYS